MKKWDSSGPLIGWLADVARFTVFCPNYLVTSNSKMWMFDGFSAYFGKFRIRLSIPIFWGGFCTLPHSIFLLFPPCLFSLLFFFFLSSVLSPLFSLFDKDILPPPTLVLLTPFYYLPMWHVFGVLEARGGKETDRHKHTDTHTLTTSFANQSIKPLHELWRILWTTSDLCTHLLIYGLAFSYIVENL